MIKSLDKAFKLAVMDFLKILLSLTYKDNIFTCQDENDVFWEEAQRTLHQLSSHHLHQFSLENHWDLPNLMLVWMT